MKDNAGPASSGDRRRVRVMVTNTSRSAIQRTARADDQAALGGMQNAHAPDVSRTPPELIDPLTALPGCVTRTYDDSLPGPGIAEVRITAASPDVARQVAQELRAWFASTEQRSYPAGDTGTGTCLHLTVDTARPRRTDQGQAPGPPPEPVEVVGRVRP